MHTYRETKKGHGGASVWVVGHYFCVLNGTSEWWPLSDHDTEKGAMMRVHYLNGGNAQEIGGLETAIYSFTPLR